jgi:hypothetical protein
VDALSSGRFGSKEGLFLDPPPRQFPSDIPWMIDSSWKALLIATALWLAFGFGYFPIGFDRMMSGTQGLMVQRFKRE